MFNQNALEVTEELVKEFFILKEKDEQLATVVRTKVEANLPIEIREDIEKIESERKKIQEQMEQLKSTIDPAVKAVKTSIGGSYGKATFVAGGEKITDWKAFHNYIDGLLESITKAYNNSLLMPEDPQGSIDYRRRNFVAYIEVAIKQINTYIGHSADSVRLVKGK